MAFSSSSSSSSSTFKYDVYISFRGEDTRFGFTSHLLEALRYRKIHAFFDDKEIQKGDEITQSLFFNAIQNSKIAIVVLSDNYASSRYCLEEVSYIHDNFKGNRHRHIIPIFYGVEPSIVRNLQGAYGEAFERHEETYFKDNYQKLQKWRNALNQIAYIPGFHFCHQVDYESKFIERIVNQVFFHTTFTVGLESPLKEVCSLLELDSGAEVHMVGIYGAAGIGKTTLAQAVYHTISDQFGASYFLPDMGENSNSNIHSLTHLQNMLLSDMVGINNIHLQSAQEVSILIQKRLQHKKVLLVLDGVDNLEQLEALVGVTGWLGFGSKVIITTRNKSLLGIYEIVRTYEVKPLHGIDALELLRQHILKDGNADQSNKETLNELVTYAAGLPLALKEIGSYLFGKSVDEWTSALRQFKRVPPQEIQRKLKSSNPPSDSEALSNSSQGGAEQGNPPSGHEGSYETSRWFEGVDRKTLMWRVVGALSGLVGPFCFALSPPSKCLNRGQNLLFILCSVWSLVICAFVVFVKSSSLSKLQSSFLCYGVFLIITGYSFFYDKVVDNNPSILGAVSNLAFALVSLSKSQLDRFGFETGTFCYFLACFTMQLMDIKLWLFFVSILLSCPLFLFHFLSRSKDDNGDQTLPLFIQKVLSLFIPKILPVSMPKTNDTGLQNLGKKAE